jgi:hypothetical protein
MPVNVECRNLFVRFWIMMTADTEIFKLSVSMGILENHRTRCNFFRQSVSFPKIRHWVLRYQNPHASLIMWCGRNDLAFIFQRVYAISNTVESINHFWAPSNFLIDTFTVTLFNYIQFWIQIPHNCASPRSYCASEKSSTAIVKWLVLFSNTFRNFSGCLLEYFQGN